LRLMPIQFCQPGMKLGKKIYNEDGLVLLSEHIELTPSMILRLEQLGLRYLYIEDARTDDILIPELISEETKRESMYEIRKNFRELMNQPFSEKQSAYPSLGKNFRKVITNLIDDLSSHEDAMIMLSDINSTDFYLYRHSLNVCIYTVMMALSKGYNSEELNTIALGALLHDVGKTQIPMEVLLKPDKLTDEEYRIIQQHTELGYRILKDEANIPLLAAHCAFQHHERIDGTGYPRGIKGVEIHEYSKMIGIVDSYDAMTSHRIYRSAMMPHQALEILYTGSGTLYEQGMLELFRDRIAIYPIGVTVKLNTGEIGVVVDLNSTSPQRPIIRILYDEDGQELSSIYDVDLSVKLNLMIVAVLTGGV